METREHARAVAGSGVTATIVLRSLNDVLNNVRSQPTWGEFRQLELIRRLWADVVGDTVAAHSIPIRLQRQTLYVTVSAPTWAQTLTFQRQLILTKLNPRLTKPISTIRFSPGQWHRYARQAAGGSTAADSQHGAIGQAWRSPSTPSQPTVAPPQSPQEAFQRWAVKVKRSQVSADMAPCPVCQRPALPAELDRWFVCGLCRMQSPK